MILFPVVWCRQIPSFLSSSEIRLQPQSRFSFFISKISFLTEFDTPFLPGFRRLYDHLPCINLRCQASNVGGLTKERCWNALRETAQINDSENRSFALVLMAFCCRRRWRIKISFSFFSISRTQITSFRFVNNTRKKREVDLEGRQTCLDYLKLKE